MTIDTSQFTAEYMLGLNTNDTLTEDMVRELTRNGRAGVRRSGPTIEDPFGRVELMPLDGMVDPLQGYNQHVENQQQYQTVADTVGAIDYEAIRRAQEEMFRQQDPRQEERLNRNRITNYEFMNELDHRLSSYIEFNEWLHQQQFYNKFAFIIECAMDYMKYGSGRNASRPLASINDELNQLERNKMDVDK